MTRPRHKASVSGLAYAVGLVVILIAAMSVAWRLGRNADYGTGRPDVVLGMVCGIVLMLIALGVVDGIKHIMRKRYAGQTSNSVTLITGVTGGVVIALLCVVSGGVAVGISRFSAWYVAIGLLFGCLWHETIAGWLRAKKARN